MQVDKQILVRVFCVLITKTGYSMPAKSDISQNRARDQIANLLCTRGYIFVDEFMQYALSGSLDSYYRSLEHIGPQGDFVTAPEISQMFGEIIAIWVIEQVMRYWQKHAPQGRITLIELGCGTGKMMSDILRTIEKITPDIYEVLHVQLYDINRKILNKQQQNLAPFLQKITWIADLNEIPSGANIILANEFFDALPIKQFQKKSGQWHHRVITDISGEGSYDIIALGAPDEGLHQQLVRHVNAQDGAIFEYPLQGVLLWQDLLLMLQRRGSDADLLVIDYGYLIAPETRDINQYKDSVQAVSNHQYCSIFSHIGHADLTAHVDFYQLLHVADMLGCHSKFSTQGKFLSNYGINLRASELAKNTDATNQALLQKQLKRLIDPKYMGNLFKVLHVSVLS
jgi:SAM-dependent MidA family methyltransferase